MKGGRGFGGRRSTDGKGSTICRLNQSLRQTDKEEKLSLQGPHGGNTANILNKPGSETKTGTALEYVTLCPCSSHPLPCSPLEMFVFECQIRSTGGLLTFSIFSPRQLEPELKFAWVCITPTLGTMGWPGGSRDDPSPCGAQRGNDNPKTGAPRPLTLQGHGAQACHLPVLRRGMGMQNELRQCWSCSHRPGLSASFSASFQIQPPGAVPRLPFLSFLRLSLSREEPALIFLLLVAVKFFCW